MNLHQPANLMFHNRFDGNTTHKAQLQVCLISNKVHCRVDFRDTPNTTENNNLLSTLNMRFSSPSIDHQVSHLFKLFSEID